MNFSGLNKIDAILGTQTGIYEAANNNVEVRFATPSVSGVTNLSNLDSSQVSAVWQALAYVSSVTGVNFVAAGTPGAGSNITFCVGDITGAGYNGWCEYNGGTSYDIVIDTVSYSYLANFAPGSSAYQILLHEIGHSLGLDHSFDGPYTLPAGEDNTSNTLMSYNWSGVHSTYSPYDLLALSWIYGGDGVKGVNGIGGTNGPTIPQEAYPPVAHSISGGADTVVEGSGTFSFTVTRSGNTSVATTVAWTVSGTINAADFGGALPSGVVSFAAGETSKTITFNAFDDSEIESSESVVVTLGSPTGAGAVLGDDKNASFTLVDDDTPPTVSITPTAAAVEGNAGSSNTVDFVITRTGFTDKASTIQWSFAAASTTPEDFAGGTFPKGGTLSFAPGQKSITLQIPVAGDTTIEGDEQFIINIAPVTFAAPGTVQGIGTIVSDDVNNTFSVAAKASSITEGNTGTQGVDFIITRNGVTSEAATVYWQREGRVNNDDLGASNASGGPVYFAAGETSKTVHFDVRGDTRIEDDETLSLRLVAASGLGAGLDTASSATTTVVSDDPKAKVTVTPGKTSVNEGQPGSQVTHTFTLVRDGDLTDSATIAWTVGGTATASDYADANGGLPAGTALFAAGKSSTTVTLTTQGDALFEPDETITLVLGNGDRVAADPKAPAATVTLINDDVPNEFRIRTTTPTITEGSTPGVKTSARFEITRVGDVTTAATVEWAVTGSGAYPADAVDFGTALPSGKLSWAIGETSKALFVPVIQDKTPEADEGFTVQLMNGSGAGVSSTQGSAEVTILSDDPLPKVAITANLSEIAEGNSGATPMVFTVTRSGDLSKSGAVDWKAQGTSPGTDASDFAPGQAMSGKVTFAAGESQKTISLLVQGDKVSEYDEAILVTLSNGVDVLIDSTKATATTTIHDDDPAMRVITGSANVYNEAVTLKGRDGEYTLSFNPADDTIKITDTHAGRDPVLLLKNVDVLHFTDGTLQLLPNANEKVLVEIGQAIFGRPGLTLDLYGIGSGYMAQNGVQALATLAADALFGQATATQMASSVLANLGVTEQTLGGADPHGTYVATLGLLSTMFSGDSAARGASLIALVDTLGKLEADATYGNAAATYNDNISTEWLAKFADHPVTLAGVPTTVVEMLN